jgi:hypothetical protein
MTETRTPEPQPAPAAEPPKAEKKTASERSPWSWETASRVRPPWRR